MPSGSGAYTYSEIAEYLRCRYRHDLGYRRGVRLRLTPRPLAVGTVIHRELESLAGGRLLDAEGLEELRQDIGALETEETIDEYINTGAYAALRFWDAFNSSPHGDAYQDMNRWEPIELDGWRFQKAAGGFANTPARHDTGEPIVSAFQPVPLVEQTLRYKLTHYDGPSRKAKEQPPAFFEGTPDLVAKDTRTGYNWLIDYKSSKTMPSAERVEEVNLQSAIYQYLLLKHGIETVGFVRASILADRPKQPVLNQDGKMSRADIRTTWPVYRNALLLNHLDPADYEDMRTKLEAKEWWRITETYRGPDEVKAIWMDIVRPILQELSRKPGRNAIRPVRNLGSITCQGCWARDHCLAELRGGKDLDYLMEVKYAGPNDQLLITPTEALEWALGQDLED